MKQELRSHTLDQTQVFKPLKDGRGRVVGKQLLNSRALRLVDSWVAPHAPYKEIEPEPAHIKPTGIERVRMIFHERRATQF